jgi:hypothetical protein
VSLNGQEFTSFPGKYTYVTQHQLTDAEILASQSGSDPEAFTSWIDSQVNPDGTVSDFYNAFYGAAESECSAFLRMGFVQRVKNAKGHVPIILLNLFGSPSGFR